MWSRNPNLINTWTAGNAWVHNQYCDYWCPRAKAPNHQYPSANLVCIFIAMIYTKSCYEKLKLHFKKITQLFNTSWPIDIIWWHRSGRTLAQVVDWCLTAPSHYLHQCWLPISQVLQHSPVSDYRVNAHPSILYNENKNYTFKITATSS